MVGEFVFGFPLQKGCVANDNTEGLTQFVRSQRKEVHCDAIRFLNLIQSLLGCLQQTRIVDGNRSVCGSDGKNCCIAFVENTVTFVDSFQYANGPILDWHWDTEQC